MIRHQMTGCHAASQDNANLRYPDQDLMKCSLFGSVYILTLQAFKYMKHPLINQPFTSRFAQEKCILSPRTINSAETPGPAS
jgi:hypothetical protein